MTNNPRSKVPYWISGIYLGLALFSWVLPLVAKPDESMSGIFLVLFIMPWTFVLNWIQEAAGIDSFVFNMAFSLLAILVNTWIIYRVFAWLLGRRS